MRDDPFRAFMRNAEHQPHGHQVQPTKVLRLTRRRPPQWDKLGLCLAAKAILWVALYYLLNQAYDDLGVEIDLDLEGDELLGWVFSWLPGVTLRHVYAAVGATFFLAVPFSVWLRANGPEGLFRGSPTHNAVSGFMVFCYAVILVGEFLLIFHRVDFASASAFSTQTTVNRELAIFFSALIVLIHTAVALLTAHYAAPKHEGAV